MELYKEGMLSNSPIPESISTIIDADVKRSFKNFERIDAESLANILITYAYHNPEVGYCQGMNFIAGFLYLILQDESKAFVFLNRIIGKYEMNELYSKNIPLLKKHFYKMDRLLYMYYPELTACLRNEGINSSLFSSTWFITLFTNSLQANDELEPNTFLLAIWDTFLLYGWKAIYKTGLFIIGKLEPQLMKSKFDQMMMTFTELIKGNSFKEKILSAEFKQRFSEIKLTNITLELLSKEYKKVTGSNN